jgi:hypothetical protein
MEFGAGAKFAELLKPDSPFDPMFVLSCQCTQDLVLIRIKPCLLGAFYTRLDTDSNTP